MALLLAPRRTALMMALAVGAFGQEPALPALDERDAALMQLYLGATSLGDGLGVFPSGNTALVPLGELCRLLQFPIEVDAPAGRARGYFIRPGRTFTLDLASRSVLLEGRRLGFAPDQVRRVGSELYVAAPLLEAWFPLTVKPLFRDSSLYLTSKETLPLEEGWKRDQLNARLLAKRPGASAAKGPLLEHPYQAFTLPMADLSFSAQHASSGGGSTPQFSASLAGDLLWMSAQAYLTRDSKGSFESSRITLFRDDPGGKLLGPLHARHLSLGDLQRNAALGLVGGLPQGRGIALDNHPMDFRASFATRVFRGNLPLGWSVELFHNGGLVAYQQARADATYELPPVNLTFGLNTFKLTFHGPHGELREENIRLDISQDQPEPGTLYYRMAAIRPTLLETDKRPGQIQVEAKPAYLAEAEYGLSPWISVLGGLMRLQHTDGARSYGLAGARAVLPWLSIDALGAASTFSPVTGADSQRGSAGQLVLRTGIGYSSLTASHADYRKGFLPVSEVTANRQSPLRTEDNLMLSSTTQLGRTPLSASLNYRRQGFESGWQESQRLTLGTSLGRFSFSQGFGLTTERSTTGKITRSQDAQLLVASTVGSYALQGEVTGRKPQGGSFELENYATNLTRVFHSGLSLQATLRGAFRGSGGPSLSASLLQQKGRFGWGLDGSYSKSNSSIGIRLQVSVGRDPRSRRWFTDAQPMSGMGAVSARAFLDANGNGRKDPDERFLEEPRFRVGDTARPEVRADAHTALYTSVGAGRHTQIALDGSSLEDTSLQPRVPSYTLVPRPGVVTPVDYPVVVLGEVMGTCRLRRGTGLAEMPGLLVELADAAGRVVQSQRSAYDGFFEFRDLPLGQYRLRVPQAEVERLKLKAQPTRTIDLTLKKAYAEGQDLVVEYLSAPAEPQLPAPTPAEPRKPDPAQAPQIHVFPRLDQKGSRSLEALPLLPGLKPIVPGTKSLSLLPTRLAPAPRIGASRTAVPALRSLQRKRVPSKPLPRPSAAGIEAARTVARATAALLLEDFRPWTAGSLHPVAPAPPAHPALRPTTPPNPESWTLLLLTARNQGTVELMRKRLGYRSRDLVVHRPGGGAPMQLLLGRYGQRASAENARRQLPNLLPFSGSAPSVVLFPADGAIS